MTTQTITPQPRTEAASQAQARVTLPRLIRAEWIKLVSLRSPWWAAALVFAISVGVSAMYALASTTWDGFDPSNGGSPEMANTFIASVVTMPAVFTVLLASILGVILITGEYSTGMIRSTLTAAPDRLRSLLAKATVLSVFIFAVSIITSLVSLLLVITIFGGAGLGYTITDPATSILPYVLNAAYLVLLALMGLGIGYLVRNGAGALSIVVAIIFVLPIVASMVGMAPGLEWLADASKYLPMNAGSLLVQGEPEVRGGAAIALGLWALVPLIGGALVLKTRDA